MSEVPQIRRRDMLEAERVAGKPFGQLFATVDGQQVATALGSLAIQFVLEKRNGVTDLEWDSWLDGEPDDMVVEAADPS